MQGVCAGGVNLGFHSSCKNNYAARVGHPGFAYEAILHKKRGRLPKKWR